MTPAIELRNLTYRYGPRTALSDVSLSVPVGRIFGLLGPNGSGKTTLFRILATIARIQPGSVRIDGIDPAVNPGAVRRRLGIVFQSPALDVHLSPAENLRHHGHLYNLHGRDLAARIDSALHAVGLSDRAGDRVKTFSGGMKRRVEIAKALLHSPKILLLDEPSTGLDPAARLDLWTQLRLAQRHTGVTLLLSTHLMDEAEKCDELAILSRGSLVAHGTPDQLKRGVGGQILRLATRDPQVARAALESLSLRPVDQQGELRIDHPAAPELIPRIATLLGDQLTSLALGQPTLEDVFLQLTGQRLTDDQSAPEPEGG